MGPLCGLYTHIYVGLSADVCNIQHSRTYDRSPRVLNTINVASDQYEDMLKTFVCFL